MKNRTRQKKEKGFALSVSRKFYDEIMERVDVALSAQRAYHLIIMDIKHYLCEYLIHGHEPQMRLPELEHQLTIALLKPEIEKAIARSARARERRRSKKEMQPTTPTDSEIPAATSACAKIPAVTPAGAKIQAAGPVYAKIPPLTIQRTPQMLASETYGTPIKTTVIDLDALTPPVASIVPDYGNWSSQPGYAPLEPSANLFPQLNRQWWEEDNDIFRQELPDEPELAIEPAPHDASSGALHDAFYDASVEHDATHDASHGTLHDAPHDASSGQAVASVMDRRRRHFLKQARRLARKSTKAGNQDYCY